MLKGFNVIILLSVFVYTSCGVPESEYEQLKSELEATKLKLDECQNGEERLSAEIRNAYSDEDYSTTKEKINLLINEHPHSSNIEEFQDLLVTIEEKIKEERERKLAEERERKRLENLNNTGIWQVTNYVDSFGERTDKKYIRNPSLINGTFSNTATQDSPLDVRFLINSSDKIYLMLYEYAGNNPVKAVSNTWYRVQVRDSNGDRYDLRAVNSSDRLEFFPVAQSRELHSILMKGGRIMFRITEDRNPTTQYEFTISNADWYENAYRMLTD